MSFSLPRSPRGLSFTGNFGAAGGPARPGAPAPKIVTPTPTPGVGLGKARPKKTPVPIASPYPGAGPNKVEIREIEPFVAPNAVRGKFESIDEEMPTSSFSHDALDFLAPPPKAPLPKSVQSAFSVKKAVSPDSPATVLVPGRRNKEKAGATSGRILMFVMIGLLSMMVGYRFVPMMLDRFDPPPAEQ